MRSWAARESDSGLGRKLSLGQKPFFIIQPQHKSFFPNSDNPSIYTLVSYLYIQAANMYTPLKEVH